ncbi:hypothetical protein TRFO_08711 [Tritrichomonas foetus]|uniref:Bacterial surface antigen (D15) domain-containing protein n=1 Tax=Tritrichomonas foetus TaxID=1144522 RepID=A0A1J4JHX4_9EUKA|nr:hypothetical protein TRFO_08711 [Tritrichomonas foetus]|eukprot:OHS98718.1 hypothetical protein TRFO_08711 [Tritrichomonas foetus]
MSNFHKDLTNNRFYLVDRSVKNPKMFHRKPPRPNWFSESPIRKEMERIQSLKIEYEKKNEMIKELIEKIKPIKSIKSIEIHRLFRNGHSDRFNPFILKVVPRCGQLATSIGGETGTTHSVHISTGYANFFYENEYVEFSAKIRSDSSPKFTLNFTKDLINEADFSLSKNCFTTYSLSASYDMNTFKKQKIHIASISATAHKKGSDLVNTASLSMVNEDHSADAPPAMYFDPSPYFKASIKTESASIIPTLAALSELSLLLAKSSQKITLIPFLKVRSNISKTLQSCNLKGHCSGGFILSPFAVPFAEKFKIGGIPIARGVDNDEFGPKIGNFPSGCDAYISGTLEFFQPVFPEQNFNAHFFVNGAVAGNFKSNNIFDVQPHISSILTCGTGFIFQQGPIQVELNAQLPYYVSEGIKTLKYQIGFTPV